jgi:predicted RNase H-like HicB family nuclease
MKKRHFPVTLEQDKDGVFIVSCPVFKGCHSYGYTIDEAIENITEAIEVCHEENEDEQTTFIGMRDIELAI